MGSCLGKTADCPDVIGESGTRTSPSTAMPESLSENIGCGAGGHLHKANPGGNSLEEVVNQLIRETLCVIGSIVEK